MTTPVSELVRRYDPSLPLEQASTPPAAWYTDPRIAALERDTVFARTWQFAGRLDPFLDLSQYPSRCLGAVDVREPGAQQFILEKVPAWVQKYGKDTAFFCTNDAHTEPLLKQLLQYGGYFVEADLPSPLMGYPGALGIDLSAEAGNFPAILKKVESAVVAKGGAGRFGTWAFSYGFTVTAGLGEFAKNVIEGKATKNDLNALYAAFSVYTPGAQWNGGNYIDANTGVSAKNHILVYMDTYVFGKGYLPTTKQVVPEKYYDMKFNK